MRHLMHSHFVRQVATLLTGKAMAQVLSIVLVPIIARLFDPADFGIVAIFVTVASMLGLVAPLRYFRASLHMNDDERARAVLAISAWSLVTGCVLALVVIAATGPGGLGLKFLDPLGLLLYLIPVGMFLNGMGEIMMTVHTRGQTFRTVAVADFGETLLIGCSRILLGLGGSSAWALVVGFLVGGAGRLMLLARGCMNPLSIFMTSMSWRTVKDLAIEYRDFPLYSMPAGLVTFLAGKMPILVMGMMFEPAAVGLYAMADRLIRMPVVTTGISIREVFMRKLVGNASEGIGLRRPLTLLTLGMLLLGVVPFAILGFFGAEILTVILGDRWVGAGVYVQILAPWYYAVWVTTGVHPILVALRRQGLWLQIQVSMLLMRLAIFAAGYLAAANVETTLKWFSGANVLAALATLALVFYLVSKQRVATARPAGGESVAD